MRIVRIVVGLVLAVPGLLITAGGAIAAFWLVGPDDTVDTGAQRLVSSGSAVTTAPNLLDRHGPTLHVTVTDSSRPVFVGVARDFDVASYLDGSAYTRVVRLDLPPRFGTEEVAGGSRRLTPPAELDWWTVDASGTGEQSIAWPMADGAYHVVVMNADGTPGTDARVTVGLELQGLFVTCLLVLLGGLVLLVIGVALMRRRRPAPAIPLPAVAHVPVLPLLPTYPAPSSTRADDDKSSVPQHAAPAYGRPDVVDPAETPMAVPVEHGAAEASSADRADDERRGGSDRSGGPSDGPGGGSDGPGGDSGGGSRPAGGSGEPAYVPPPQYRRVLAGAGSGGGDRDGARRTAVIAASIGLLLTATGCVALPARNVSGGPETRPAVTVVDGQAVVERYNTLNNQANRALDAAAAATIEANPTLAMTRAAYRISRTVDAARPYKPFSFVEPEIGAPEFGAYPMRFVVNSAVSDAPTSRQLGVWERVNAGAPWVLRYSAYADKSTKLPPLEGLRTPVKADLDNLATQPRSAAADLAQYLTGNTRSPKAALFETPPSTRELLEARVKTATADLKQPYIATVADVFRPTGTPVTFITSSGEALVFLTLTERYLQRIEPGSSAHWSRGAATAFSNRVNYTQTLTQDYLHQVALAIPPKGEGKLRILAIDTQLVDAGGS